MRGARADMFGSASHGKIFQLHHFRLGSRKNRTSIGPHLPAPRHAGNPAISFADAGYVRSSDIIPVDAEQPGSVAFWHASPKLDVAALTSGIQAPPPADELQEKIGVGLPNSLRQSRTRQRAYVEVLRTSFRQ